MSHTHVSLPCTHAERAEENADDTYIHPRSRTRTPVTRTHLNQGAERAEEDADDVPTAASVDVLPISVHGENTTQY